MTRTITCVLFTALAATGCRDASPARTGSAGTKDKGELKKVAELAPADLEVKGAGLHKLQAQAPSGKTVKYAIYIPSDLPKGGNVPLVVALHFAGKDSDWYGAGMIEGLYQDGCRDLKAVIVAPDSLTRDDWDNQTNLDHVIWLTRSVMKAYPIDEKRVVLSGFSAGGIGTWYIAPRAGGLFTAAVPIAGEPAVRGAAWSIPVCAIHSDADKILSPAATKKQMEKLKAEGKNANLIVLTDGTTHYQANKYVRPLQEACTWLKGIWK